MEEETNENNKSSNGKVTITLSSLALGAICILLLIAAITLLYTQTNIAKENEKLKEDVDKLQSQNSRMLKLIDDMDLSEYLEYDEVEKVGNYSNNYGYDSAAAKDFTEDQVKQSITNYMEIYDLFYNQFDKLLVKLDLMSDYEAERLLYDLDYSREYAQINVSYEDFRNAMLKYMTDITFQNTFGDDVKSKDGKLCFSVYNVDCDLWNYKVTNIEKETYFSKDNGYYVTYEYSYEYEDYDEETDSSNIQTETYTSGGSFVVTSLDGNCIISYSEF